MVRTISYPYAKVISPTMEDPFRSIKDVTKSIREKEKYVCLDCHRKMVAVLGNQVRHHFKHYTKPKFCGGGEGDLHIKGKQRLYIILKELIKSHKPWVLGFNCPCGYHDTIDLLEGITSVQMESTLKENSIDIRPDLSLYSGKDLKVAVEIHDTNRKNEETIQKFKDLDIYAVEIDITRGLIRNWDKEFIEDKSHYTSISKQLNVLSIPSKIYPVGAPPETFPKTLRRNSKYHIRHQHIGFLLCPNKTTVKIRELQENLLQLQFCPKESMEYQDTRKIIPCSTCIENKGSKSGKVYCHMRPWKESFVVNMFMTDGKFITGTYDPFSRIFNGKKIDTYFDQDLYFFTYSQYDILQSEKDLLPVKDGRYLYFLKGQWQVLTPEEKNVLQGEIEYQEKIHPRLEHLKSELYKIGQVMSSINVKSLHSAEIYNYKVIINHAKPLLHTIEAVLDSTRDILQHSNPERIRELTTIPGLEQLQGKIMYLERWVDTSAERKAAQGEMKEITGTINQVLKQYSNELSTLQQQFDKLQDKDLLKLDHIFDEVKDIHDRCHVEAILKSLPSEVLDPNLYKDYPDYNFIDEQTNLTQLRRECKEFIQRISGYASNHIEEITVLRSLQTVKQQHTTDLTQLVDATSTAVGILEKCDGMGSLKEDISSQLQTWFFSIQFQALQISTSSAFMMNDIEKAFNELGKIVPIQAKLIQLLQSFVLYYKGDTRVFSQMQQNISALQRLSGEIDVQEISPLFALNPTEADESDLATGITDQLRSHLKPKVEYSVPLTCHCGSSPINLDNRFQRKEMQTIISDYKIAVLPEMFQPFELAIKLMCMYDWKIKFPEIKILLRIGYIGLVRNTGIPISKGLPELYLLNTCCISKM